MISPEQVTQLLLEWKNGNKAAMDLLVPIVYDERAAATHQPTALVDEAYLRLAAQRMPDWESRSHFFGVAAHLMRQVLVDHARRHRSAKRGSGAPKASLDEVLGFGVGKEQ